jgi:hypothetical protein
MLEELTTIEELRSEEKRLASIAYPAKGGPIDGTAVKELSKVRQKIALLEARAERQATMEKMEAEREQHKRETAAFRELVNTPAYKRF